MALTVGLASSAALYRLTHSLPDLEHPLRSVNAFAFSDGGSLTVEIEDAAGSQFYFGIKADLESQPEMYPAYYARPFFGVPLTVTPSIGSMEERELANFARDLAVANLSADALKKVIANDIDGLTRDEFKYAVIYSIYTALRPRRTPD